MKILLGYGSCGIASGADNVLKAFAEVLEGTDITVERVGCNGLCFAEPVCEVITDNGESLLYGRLDYGSGKMLAEGLVNGTLMQENRLSEQLQPITVIVQSLLDGRIIAEDVGADTTLTVDYGETGLYIR